MKTNTEMNKTDKRVLRTYDSLFNALLQLLSQKSFDDISISEICDSAEIHRATFYKHFSNKQDFLNACFREKLKSVSLNVSDEYYNSVSLKESFLNTFEQVITFIEENIDVFSVISQKECSYPFNIAITESICDFISSRLSKRKDLAEKLGNKIGIVSSYYAGATVGLAKWWIDHYEIVSANDIRKFIGYKIDDLCAFFDKIIA